MAGPTEQGSWAARLLLASTSIDRGFRLFDRLRSELVLAFASDRTLDRFNDLAYASAPDYDPSGTSFRAYLFPWEEAVIERFFPKAPARILVGGAGSGREAFALVDRGYDVMAFDPSRGLVAAMAARATANAHLEAYVGAYEELPLLRPVRGSDTTIDLTAVAPFDASVIGWGSFSHLRTDHVRVRTLRGFGDVTRGPVVVSFLKMGSGPSTRPAVARARRRLRARKGRDERDAFSVHIGYYHVFEEREIIDLAGRAGLHVAHLSTDERETNWPHVVLTPGPHLP
jgi:SAM-dependent methyltransferase